MAGRFGGRVTAMVAVIVALVGLLAPAYAAKGAGAASAFDYESEAFPHIALCA